MTVQFRPPRAAAKSAERSADDSAQGRAKPSIDLRSDFLSRPTEAMIAAMTEAARAPNGFGVREDPLVSRLEARVAALLGKDSALFFPTCTMANQAAINAFCKPGQGLIAEAASHVLTSEAGAPSALSGAMPRPIPGKRGVMEPALVEAAIEDGAFPKPRTGLICLENTHVHSGGAVVPLAAMQDVKAVADKRGIPVHLDGSRLFNAAVVLGCSARDLARYADTVSISLNKGLGAPLGAMLAGSSAQIELALAFRQLVGGGWRTAGILAAAGLVALDTMVDRLAQDHARARTLAQGLAAHGGLEIDPAEVETNILRVKLRRGSAAKLAARLEVHGVKVLPVGPDVLRLVTYHDVSDVDIDRVLGAFAAVLSAVGNEARR